MKILSKILIMGIVAAVSFASCKKDKPYSPPPPGLQKHRPVADAGADRVFTAAPDSISLDGTASTDADGNIHSYVWTVISGPPDLIISDQLAIAAIAKKNQPGALQGGVYEFQLTVTDNDGLSSTDRVVFTIPGKTVTARVLEYGTDIPIEDAEFSLSMATNFQWPYTWENIYSNSDQEGKCIFSAEKYMVRLVSKANYWGYDIQTFHGDDPNLVSTGVHNADSFSIWKIPQTTVTVHIQNSIATLTQDAFFYQYGNFTMDYPGEYIYLRPGIDTTFQYRVCGNMENTFLVDYYDYDWDSYSNLHTSSLYVPKQNSLTVNIIY